MTVSGQPPVLTSGSLATQIYGSMEEAIIDGRFAPGSRVRAGSLAEYFGVSRIPVREALSALGEAGWVDLRPRYGVYVRERSQKELAELFEARQGIESELARLAATRATDSDRASLASIVAMSRDAAKRNDQAAISHSAREFNAEVRRVSGNRVLAVIGETLEKRARFYFHPVATELGADWAHGQDRLLGLLHHDRRDDAAESARLHIGETGHAVMRLLPTEAFSE